MEGIKDENGRIKETVEEVAADGDRYVEASSGDTGNIVEGNKEDTESKVLLLDETEEIDKEIQKKPKKKRTEKQIQAFELARKKRAENIAARKKLKEENTKPVGRPKKVKQPEPEPEPELAPVRKPNVEDVIQEEEEEIIEYRKKPKKKKPKKKIVYVSSSSEEESEEEYEEEVIVKEIQKPKLARQTTYQQEYRQPTSIRDFYKVY
tara:strand:- start:572 stop:1192 length:621 start_codon:yes stop_codon:yes gene_type:complete